MRSRLDTITRLAAHVAAVVLFIVVWISSNPRELDTVAEKVPGDGSMTIHLPAPIGADTTAPTPAAPASADTETLAASDTPAAEPADATAERADPELPGPPEPTLAEGPPENMVDHHVPQGRKDEEEIRRRLVLGPGPASLPDHIGADPEDEPVPPAETDEQPSDTPEQPPEPELPPVAEPTPEAEDAPPASLADDDSAQVESDTPPAPTPEPAVEPEEEPASETVAETTPVPSPPAPISDEPATDNETESIAPATTDTETPAEDEPEPPAGALDVQPDESGALVVAEGADGAPVAAALPLPEDAGLEVLGDGIYWIGSDSPLAEKVAHLPAATKVIVLTPGPNATVPVLFPTAPDVIPAVGEALDDDNAERFVRALAGDGSKAVAVLPDAWGAAYFKGAYLMAVRGLDLDLALPELAAELDQAGDHRAEVIHRLRRLDTDRLRSLVQP